MEAGAHARPRGLGFFFFFKKKKKNALGLGCIGYSHIRNEELGRGLIPLFRAHTTRFENCSACPIYRTVFCMPISKELKVLCLPFE
jgi:hypothetical protein